jgi:hypothetical protein
MHEAGDDWWCVADWPDSGGGGGGGGGGTGGSGADELGGGATGGGDSGPVRQNGWDDETWQEAKRRWKCGLCKKSAAKCASQAHTKENRCLQDAKAQALWRCNVLERRKQEVPTVTAFGCSIDHHARGLCTVSERPWNDPSIWSYECRSVSTDFRDRTKTEYKCIGDGVYNCEQSWALSHPGGSAQTVDSGTLSALFEGFGGTASKTVTANYTLSPMQGYIKSCTDAGDALARACNEQRDACYEQYKCGQGDM